jgi:ABC-type Na+ efflux pump permease subunit
LIPALAMRMLAEERRAGTLDWLRAKPLSTWNIVLGKWLETMAKSRTSSALLKLLVRSRLTAQALFLKAVLLMRLKQHSMLSTQLQIGQSTCPMLVGPLLS